MEQDEDQKTEAPTSKRLEQAREHGQLPISREAAMWVSFLGIVAVMGFVAPSMMRELALYLKGFLEAPDIALDESGVQTLFLQVFLKVGLICGIAFLLMVGAIVAGFMMQTGFFYSLDLLVPDFTKVMPSHGLKRLFSLSALVELAKSLCKLAILGGLAYAILKPIALMSPQYSGFPVENLLAFLHKNLMHMIEVLLLAFTIIAALDLFYTRFQYTRNLRMTKVEVKDEYKQQEGDPMIKARLRQIRLDRTRRRMMAQVPKADVVITNPTHYAVALQYDMKKMAAPVVVAKGINLIATRIREIADEHDVPLVSNPPLARALHDTVELDQPIPTQHYRAVAEVISYVYKLKKRKF